MGCFFGGFLATGSPAVERVLPESAADIQIERLVHSELPDIPTALAARNPGCGDPQRQEQISEVAHWQADRWSGGPLKNPAQLEFFLLIRCGINRLRPFIGTASDLEIALYGGHHG